MPSLLKKCIVLAGMTLLMGCNKGPSVDVEVFKTSLQGGDQAQVLESLKICEEAQEETLLTELQGYIVDYYNQELQAAYTAYNQNEMTYEEVQNLREIYATYGLDEPLVITEESLGSLKASKQAFEEANELVTNKDFKNAMYTYKQVIAEDTNYAQAQEKASKCEVHFYNAKLEEAEATLGEGKWQEALAQGEDVHKVMQTEGSAAYKEQVRTLVATKFEEKYKGLTAKETSDPIQYIIDLDSYITYKNHVGEKVAKADLVALENAKYWLLEADQTELGGILIDLKIYMSVTDSEYGYSDQGIISIVEPIIKKNFFTSSYRTQLYEIAYLRERDLGNRPFPNNCKTEPVKALREECNTLLNDTKTVYADIKKMVADYQEGQINLIQGEAQKEKISTEFKRIIKVSRELYAKVEALDLESYYTKTMGKTFEINHDIADPLGHKNAPMN